jgi:hypothetical protein
VTAKTMNLRRDGTCSVCGVALPAGSTARWDSGPKTVTCLPCVAAQVDEERQPVADAPQEPPATISSGTAGASAQREYERRHAKREEKVRARHPRIGGLILALSDEPRSTTAWAKGAVGERKVAEALEALRSEQVIVLHDRKVPRSSANIDHVVVAPSGIHVIDAKRYTGKVEIRPSGSLFRPGPNLLFVGGRNKTVLVEKMAGQVAVVRRALDGVVDDLDLDQIVRPSLCFIDAEWGWFAKPEMLQGVRIGGPKSLISYVNEAGTLSPEQILEIGSTLATTLKPA